MQFALKLSSASHGLHHLCDATHEKASASAPNITLSLAPWVFHTHSAEFLLNKFRTITVNLTYLYLSRYVLKELIETEKHYVADLGFIVEVNLKNTQSALTEKKELSHPTKSWQKEL